MVGKIVNKKVVAEGTLQVTFALSEPVSFKSGQYVFVRLLKLLYPDDRGGRRQFSINNPPSQSSILTITTRLSESGFKKTLNELPIGSEVELGPIAGVFTLPQDMSKPLVFMAGGIGITPFLSMLEYIKGQNLSYKITLVYSNRNQASSAYLPHLQELAKSLPNYKLILTMTDDNNWQGERRKIDAGFITEYFPNFNDYGYMAVGPPGFVEAAEKSLIEAGVVQENIKTENFSGY